MITPVIHDRGLSESQVRERLKRDGPNELPASGPRGVLRLLLDVVMEPMFLLLVACGSVYMMLGSRHEALMLLGFVFVVMGISFFQQRRTERSLEALCDLSSPRALVVRDGQARRVAGRELVCGDLVLLAEGDRVPADIRLIESSNLTVDESMLTGESVPVAKHAASTTPAAPIANDTNDVNDANYADYANGGAALDNASHAFSGTLVTQGTAYGRVMATGVHSALGRIGKSLASIGSERTPIQQETGRIVRRVAAVGLLLAAGLAIAYWLTRGDWLRGLLAGLTLAMGILPEELPVILTIFLGLGAWRLAREKILARSIPAVELLGATTVLCVDKTGTLTANRMTLRRLWSEAASYDVARSKGAPLQEELHGVLEFAVLASHRRTFDPMESAIAAAGQRLLADTEHLHTDWTLVDDYPLSREMLAMSRVWQSPDRRERMIAAKGAPEAIVDLCHLDAARAARIAVEVSRMASEGLRVLGVASAAFGAARLPGNQHDFEFEFLGLIALEDPVRPDVPQAIAECRAAGIRVVMITGDHPATAISIARQAGLTDGGKIMTGSELQQMQQMQQMAPDLLRARLAATDVFCRVQPEQKLLLVQAFREMGEIVAMTGDGVNDAPALKAAHIGVAMGARGTDVAREAAALVLLNDDFSSLVTAVRYGRRVFANLRKAIAFVVAVHVPIVGLSIVPVLLGWPLLLMPVHILFLQLIIDPACSIVFEAEALEPGAMKTRPRRPGMRLFDAAVLARGLWQGGGLLAMLLAVYASARAAMHSDDIARALTFIVLVLSNLGLILANRTWDRPFWRNHDASNPQFGWISLASLVLLGIAASVPGVGRLFAFETPPPEILMAGVGAALIGLAWFEAVKWGVGRRERKGGKTEEHRPG